MCQRKTYKVDIHHGKKLYPAVEQAMVNYFEREINCHIKIEMLKRTLQLQPDWNTKAAFNLIDSQRQGYISHPQIYAFLNFNGHDASNAELIAIVRRIDGSGNGTIEYDEFKLVCEPIVLKTTDIVYVEDQGENMRQDNGEINSENARPFKKGPPQIVQPLSLSNDLEANLKLYDNYMSFQGGQTPARGRL